MQLERPETNELRVLTIVPIYAESDSRSRLEPNPAGGTGRYEVIFVLGTPGSDTFHESLDLSALESSGDSLIVTGRSDVAEVRVELIPADHGMSQLPEIRIRTNKQGALAQARVSVEAQDFDSAQRLAYEVVAPLFSRWSFELDVAIEINGYQPTELDRFGALHVRPGRQAEGSEPGKGWPRVDWPRIQISGYVPGSAEFNQHLPSGDCVLQSH